MAEPRRDPFAIAFQLALAHGLCVGVVIPPENSGDAAGLERLDARERSWAATLPPRRRSGWIAGRIALRSGLEVLGLPVEPVGSGPNGEPRLPHGATGSISHKRDLAVALAAPIGLGTVGVDLESDVPVDARLARRVLTPAERAARRDLEAAAGGRDLLIRFALKEALYKALHPWVRRRVGFQEVEAEPTSDGGARVALHLAGAPHELDAEARWQRRDGWVLATARVRAPASAGQPV